MDEPGLWRGGRAVHHPISWPHVVDYAHRFTLLDLAPNVATLAFVLLFGAQGYSAPGYVGIERHARPRVEKKE